jgi:hypothetical protein
VKKIHLPVQAVAVVVAVAPQEAAADLVVVV